MIERRSFIRSVGSLAALLPFGLDRKVGANPSLPWVTVDSIGVKHMQAAERFMEPFVARYPWLGWHLSVISVSDSLFLNFYHIHCAFSIPDEPLQDCLIFGVRESPNGPMKLPKPTADTHNKMARLLARWDELGRLREASHID